MTCRTDVLSVICRPLLRSRVRLIVAALSTAVALGASSAAQGGAPETVARAFFDALASGSAEQFESMARQHYAPQLLARRTADDRRQLLERIRTDFGTLTWAGLRNINDEQLTVRFS